MAHAQTLTPPLAFSLPNTDLYLAEVVALSDTGDVLVRTQGEVGAPSPARLAAPHGREAVLAAIAGGYPAVLARVTGSAQPVLLSFLVPASALAADAPPPALSQSPDRVVLRAGRATMTLHSNGKMVLRGVRIVAQARQDYRVMSRMIRLN